MYINKEGLSLPTETYNKDTSIIVSTLAPKY